MPRVRSPKRGSMSFSPRKRAKNIAGRIDYWPEVEEGPQLLGFAGYKAGMTHLFYIEDRERAPEYGQEVKSAATILDTPPMLVCGIRAYKKTQEGLKAVTEAWMANPPADLIRKNKTLVGYNPDRILENVSSMLDEVDEIRIIAATQPRMAGVHKKVPDLMEIAIGGGSMEERFKYAKGLLGRDVSASDIFEQGEAIDVIGVTKAKGFQGPVKRWGIRIRQHKSRKTKRGVASIGPWVPRRVMPQVPRAGQMGFHHRTDYNKRIMLMGSEGERINPEGGFQNYGPIRGEYLLLKGSVVGPPKRLIKLRKSVRRPKHPEEAPQITYLNTDFQRGGG